MLLKKIEEMRTHPSNVGDGQKDLLLNRLDVIALVKEHYQEIATIENALGILAEREGSINFAHGYVKIKFPDCPAFTADNLREALDIALKLSGKEEPR
jgi:hypothetical protein